MKASAIAVAATDNAVGDDKRTSAGAVDGAAASSGAFPTAAAGGLG